MPRPPDVRAVSISTAGYEDGLGRRSVRFDREVGGMLECLHLRPELWAFEASLRARADAIAALDDERFVRVRTIERTPHGVVVVSELVPGQRLTDVIETRQRDDSATFGIDAAIGFLLQTLPALSALHAASIAHGTLSPGRIVVTPASQIVLLDGIYAVALERLKLKRSALWSSLGLIVPSTPGGATFDRQSDIGQAAMCALYLAVGRLPEGAGDPSALAPLLREISELAEIRAGAGFTAGVQRFFGAALPLGRGAPVMGIDEAVAEIRRLASFIGEETSHAAFAELTRIDTTVARTAPAIETVSVVRPATGRGDRAEPERTAITTQASKKSATTPPPPVAPRTAPISHASNDREGPTTVGTTIVEPSRAGQEESPKAGRRQVQAPLLEPAALGVAADVQTANAPSRGTPWPAPEPTPTVLLPRPIAIQAPVAVQQTSAAQPTEALPLPAAPFVPMRAVPAAAPPPASATPVAPIAAVSPAPPTAAATPAPRVSAGPPYVAPAAPTNIRPHPIVAPARPAVPVVSPPIAVAPVQPGILKIRAEPPPGYTPARSETGSVNRALPFIDRPPTQEAPTFPWKLVAAAALVLTVGIFTGRSYIQGRENPSDSADASASTTGPTPAVTSGLAGATGRLVVDSQPSGARVILNGADVGVTPLRLDAVAPGRHTVTISTSSATVRRTVRVDAGKQASVDVPMYSGWVSVFSPIPLDVSRDGKALGNTESGKMMLPPGKHVLTLSNREFGFTDTRTVEIHSGEERPLNIEPKGQVNVNAHPWAEVWVDGNKAGDTPIANLEVLLGTRVFVFKHPQYGERRVTATVTATGSALSVDLTKN